MEILFLGTGAADYPSVDQCSCDNCAGVRRLGGRNIRRCSSALVDGRILIDCGPHVIAALKESNVKSADVQHLLLTHSHDDHLDPDAFAELASNRTEPLLVYGHESTLSRIPKGLVPVVRIVPLAIGETVRIDSLSVEGLQANHYVSENPDEKPLHYLLSKNGKHAFYCTDSSWLLKPVWQRLQSCKLDMVVFDATLGELAADSRIFEHNNLDMIRRMLLAFHEAAILKEDARIVLTHLSLHENPPHDLWEPELARSGFMLAYDGLAVDL